MNRGIFYYLMIPMIAVACLLQATALTRVKLYGVKPDLVLLLVVMGTLIYGGRARAAVGLSGRAGAGYFQRRPVWGLQPGDDDGGAGGRDWASHVVRAITCWCRWWRWP